MAASFGPSLRPSTNRFPSRATTIGDNHRAKHRLLHSSDGGASRHAQQRAARPHVIVMVSRALRRPVGKGLYSAG